MSIGLCHALVACVWEGGCPAVNALPQPSHSLTQPAGCSSLSMQNYEISRKWKRRSGIFLSVDCDNSSLIATCGARLWCVWVVRAEFWEFDCSAVIGCELSGVSTHLLNISYTYTSDYIVTPALSLCYEVSRYCVCWYLWPKISAISIHCSAHLTYSHILLSRTRNVVSDLNVIPYSNDTQCFAHVSVCFCFSCVPWADKLSAKMDKICCQQTCFQESKWSKMRLWPGLRPDPAGGAYSAPPNPLAGLWGRGRGKG